MPLTVAQVITLAERDLRLLADVDYRHIAHDYAAAEAQMTPEFRRVYIEGSATGGPNIFARMTTKEDQIRDRVTVTVNQFTSIKPETADPAYPAATLQFIVLRSDASLSQPQMYPARVRLTFANRAGRWLLANEELFPVSK